MASQSRKDRSTRDPSRAAAPARRTTGSLGDEPSASKLSPEWLASMLLDVTAHLMNAVDKAARLRDPIERIAVATEATAEAREMVLERRRRRWRRMVIAVAVLLVLLGITLPISIRTNFFGLRAGPASSAARLQTHRFEFAGVHFVTTRAAFERKLAKVDPETIRKYWVEIDGTQFPVKQAVGVGLGAQRATFDSGEAIRVLRKLGFKTRVR